MDERIAHANSVYERMVFDGDTGGYGAAVDALDAVEADLCVARGKVLHARFLQEGESDPAEQALFERAARLYHSCGDVRGEAEALCWAGIFEQVVRRDDEAAVPTLERALDLALAAEDHRTLSFALRHLGIAQHAAGRLDDARALLERSTTLRRQLGFTAGVAANLVGLIYIAAAQDRRADALFLADQARQTAEAAGAHNILHQIAEARASL